MSDELETVAVLPPEAVQKLIDNMPMLTGAIDDALGKEMGQRLGFVLAVFPGDGVVHASNFPSNQHAVEALKLAAAALAADAAEAQNGA